MKKAPATWACLLGFTTAVVAAPAYPLEGLLVRAKFVFIAKASFFQDNKVALRVVAKLRGDPESQESKFTFRGIAGAKPEKGDRYFVFSQGHDHFGGPKDTIKMSQGLKGQAGYCGWIMLPIREEKGLAFVNNAFSLRFKNAGPLTLAQARTLVKETKFKGQSKKKEDVQARKPKREPVHKEGLTAYLESPRRSGRPYDL